MCFSFIPLGTVATVMKIEDLIAGKQENEEVEIEGALVPVATLSRLLDEGYVHLKVYEQNGALSVWGKNCAACFTREQLRHGRREG